MCERISGVGLGIRAYTRMCTFVCTFCVLKFTLHLHYILVLRTIPGNIYIFDRCITSFGINYQSLHFISKWTAMQLEGVYTHFHSSDNAAHRSKRLYKQFHCHSGSSFFKLNLCNTRGCFNPRKASGAYLGPLKWAAWTFTMIMIKICYTSRAIIS